MFSWSVLLLNEPDNKQYLEYNFTFRLNHFKRCSIYLHGKVEITETNKVPNIYIYYYSGFIITIIIIIIYYQLGNKYNFYKTIYKARQSPFYKTRRPKRRFDEKNTFVHTVFVTRTNVSPGKWHLAVRRDETRAQLFDVRAKHTWCVYRFSASDVLS